MKSNWLGLFRWRPVEEPVIGGYSRLDETMIDRAISEYVYEDYGEDTDFEDGQHVDIFGSGW